MLPYELKSDKEGLLYIDNDTITRYSPLLIDHREFTAERYYSNGFYRLYSTDEYIIKYSYTVFTRREIKEIKEMLYNLVSKQDQVPDIDFPIGYFKHGKKLAGLIIKYYKNGISCDNVFGNQDIEALGKYFAYDEDNIHNLFLLFDKTLDLIQEMFDNGIYYTDINPGNLILKDNELKLIDFDPHFVKFDNKDKRLLSIMNSYILFLKISLGSYKFYNDIDLEIGNFKEAKTFTKKLENRVRQK